MLRSAALPGLDDDFDPLLIRLDGVELNAFLPTSYEGFGEIFVREGTNTGYGIGRDIFTIADLEAAWQPAPDPEGEEYGLAILAALIFPDRTPWFLLPRIGGLLSTPVDCKETLSASVEAGARAAAYPQP